MDTLARIRLLTGDDPFWTSQNPTLLKGEVGFRNVEGDDPLMRVGDGVRPWNQLPDMNKYGPVGPIGPPGPEGPVGARGSPGPPGTATDPWHAPMSVNDALDQQVMSIKADGNGRIGPLFWLKSPDGSLQNDLNWSPGQYAQIAIECARIGPYTGANGGFRVMAGATIDDTVIKFGNAAESQTFMELHGDGSGYIRGTNPMSVMRWDADGDYSIGGHVPSGTIPRLMVVGAVGEANVSMWVWGSGSAGVGIFSNSNTSGFSSGLIVQAGLSSADNVFRCAPLAGTPFFFVLGDGQVWAPRLRQIVGAYNIMQTTGGEFVWQSSSARFKTDIQTLARERIRAILAQLRPVSFRSKCEADDPSLTHYGLIAEEVAPIDPNLVLFDEEGKPASVRYDCLATLMLPLLRELLGMAEPEAT